MTRFAGAGALLRAYLRRDRWMLVGWVAGVIAVYWSQAVGTIALYPEQSDLDTAAASMEGNAAFIAMAGPARALDTIGGQVAWQSAAFGSVVAALMSMFLVTRHTRAEEESGRDELVRSSVVGRDASLLATGIVVLLANVVVAAGIAGSLVPYDLPVAGSAALGIGAALNGVAFGAAALLAAQLLTSARAANALTGAALAVAFVLRAIGDVGPGALSWLSPIGWGQAMRAYADERWWPVLLLLGSAVALVAGALAVLHRRDFGLGAWAARPGPARGRLGTEIALAWRLQRPAVIGWSVGMLLCGVAYGSIGDGVDDLIGDSAASADLFRQSGSASLTNSFYAVSLVMLGLIACGFAVTSVLRLRGEESVGHAEIVLATGSSRRAWTWAHLTVTIVGTVVVMALAAAGIALGYGLVTGDYGYGGRLFAGGAQQAVAILVLAGLTWLLYGLSSRAAPIGWAGVVFGAVVLLFGRTLHLPTWVQDVSPFQRLALYPAESLDVGAVALLVGVAVVLFVAGDVLLRRRDLTS